MDDFDHETPLGYKQLMTRLLWLSRECVEMSLDVTHFLTAAICFLFPFLGAAVTSALRQVFVNSLMRPMVSHFLSAFWTGKTIG